MKKQTTSSPLIAAAELAGMLDRPDIKILDASYGLPDIPVRIGKASLFDIDTVADAESPLPHTLPPAEDFARHVGRLGISNNDTVIVYDRDGVSMAAARAWWMFRVFGHDKIRVLDGGLPAWVAGQYPLTPAPDADIVIAAPAVFHAVYRAELVKSQEDIALNLQKPHFTLLDARDRLRFSGLAPDPRPHIQSGHIPQSCNMHYAQFIDPKTNLFRSKADIESIIAAHNIDPAAPLAVTCGSGVTACVIALALYIAGYENVAVYDGSWSEWGGDPQTQKQTSSTA